MEFVGGDHDRLDSKAEAAWDKDVSLFIRNATYFPPFAAGSPVISLLQDIITEGPARKLQEAVIESSATVVFNSAFTASKYQGPWEYKPYIIPLPVDFSLFEPGNAMGLQQAMSLPDGAVCWIGACQGAAGQVKGWDIFLSIVRQNPDIPFVAVFKDAMPEYCPPNMRMFVKVPHEELVKIIGACRVGLCTSRVESQHLAGIEMGACGLPMVATPVGIYWREGPGTTKNEESIPGAIITDKSPDYTAAIREVRANPGDPNTIRQYWKQRYDKPVIRKQWETLVEEVESK